MYKNPLFLIFCLGVLFQSPLLSQGKIDALKAQQPPVNEVVEENIDALDTSEEALTSELQAAIDELGIAPIHKEGLIYIPRAGIYYSGDFDMFLRVGVFDDDSFDFNVGVDYAAFEKLKIGTTLVNFNNLISRADLTIVRKDKFLFMRDVKVGAGFRAFYSGANLRDDNQYHSRKENQFSHYAMVSYIWREANIHFGISRAQYDTNRGSRDGYEFLDALENYFFGLETPLGDGAFILEFDGIDFHVGFRYRFKGNTSLDVAYTDITQTGQAFSNLSARRQKYNVTLRHRENYYQRLFSESIRARKQLLSSRDDLNNMADEFIDMRDKYESLTVSHDKLQERFKSLELLQNELEEYRNHFDDNTKRIRAENATLLEELKELRGLYGKDQRQIDFSLPDYSEETLDSIKKRPTLPSQSSSKPKYTAPPPPERKTFQAVSEERGGN